MIRNELSYIKFTKYNSKLSKNQFQVYQNPKKKSIYGSYTYLANPEKESI